MAALLRIGTKVRTTDRWAITHKRPVEKREGIGKIKDYSWPFGRHGGTKTPPYFVEFEDGETGWFDAHEVERVGRDVKSR